jgi:two-component system, NarL family, sensor histidine kinase UhpB
MDVPAAQRLAPARRSLNAMVHLAIASILHNPCRCSHLARMVCSLSALERRTLQRRLLRVVAIGLFACCWAGASLGGSASALVIDSVLSVAGSAEQFPTDGTALPTALPDDWSVTRPRQDGPVWYRASFDLPAGAVPDQLFALYVERACSHLEVHLNGRRVHGERAAAESLPRNCWHPQRVVLPAAWLKPTGNLIDLKVQGHALPRVASRQRAGGLSPLHIGPSGGLAAAQAWRTFWNITAVQGLSVVLAVLGAAILTLDGWNRRSTHLRPFGWLALGWAALSVRQWQTDFGVDNSIVEFVVASAAAPMAAAAMLYLLRLAGRRWRPIERVLLPQCLLMPLTLLLAGPSRLFIASAAWNVLLGVELLAVMGQYLWLTRRQSIKQAWPMMIILIATAGLLLFELAIQLGGLPLPGIDITQLGLTLLSVGVGARLLVSFARSLQAAELGRRTLELRAVEIAAEAERNFTQMADARVEQVTAQERKRIAADLHDDLGAKLLTIVHTSDSERISSLARDALEEMRLSVRGLTGRPMQLADALADWRAETVARLGQANIEIDWRSPAEELEQTLPARSFVQTTRILRESVSNIIKHSGATHCKVRCAMHQSEFGLIIQDNGRGIPMELDGKLDRGHGMTSMKHRAKQMQGQCLVESAPGYGTVIRLTLPL